MEIRERELLSKYTTFRMGGGTGKIYFPETVDDLREMESIDREAFQYIIGGGSNLLINDSKVFSGVLCTKRLNHFIEEKTDGKYYIGSGITCQEAIAKLKESEYCGIEYLFSVPGTIGGAIYMNAGRGKAMNKSISDYVIRVDYYCHGRVYSASKEECNFSYRTSAFQRMDQTVIIGAEFEFPHVGIDEIEKNIQERLTLCRNTQDTSAPNMGSIFSECDMDIMRDIKQADKVGKVVYSDKTANWLINRGGTFDEAIREIRRVEELHALKDKRCKTEIVVWE